MEKLGLKVPLWIIAFASIIWVLERTSAALIPFVFAVFLYYIVYPVVQWIEARLKIPHFPAVVLTLLLFGLGWSLLGLVVASNVRSVMQSADVYGDRLHTFYIQTVSYAEEMGFDLQQGEAQLKEIPVFRWVQQLSGGVVNLIGQATLVGVFLLFLLAGKPASQSSWLEEIQRQVTKYTVWKTLLSLGTGTLVAIIYMILGIEMAAFFGVMAFVLNFIPNIGSLIATLLPIPIVLLQHGPGLILVLSLALPIAVQFAMGNILETKIFGDSLDLHPVVLLVALIFWGLVWGIVGMLLAVPLMAVLKIAFERMESTKPLANLLAGRIR